MKKVILFALSLCLLQIAVGQIPTREACSIMQNGTFKYLDTEDTTAYFVISNENHVEYFKSGAYKIISKVSWIDSCSYKMLMLSNTVPDFPFKPGQSMTVIIDKIEGGIIYYTSKVQDSQWPGRVIKLK